jgi:membrane-bound serine protease (ClpP class)
MDPLIWSILLIAFYQRGPEVGLIFLGVAAFGGPTVVIAAFRWWPRTALGKRLLLDVPTSEDVMPDNPERRRLRELVGKLGVAKSMMLPSGAVFVGGVTVDALSEGLPIEAGQRVKVIEVRGTRVVVRPADPDELASPAVAADDVLSQPFESLGIDPFEEPRG